MGMDWWVNNPVVHRQDDHESLAGSLASIEERMARLETSLTKGETVNEPPTGEHVSSKIGRGGNEKTKPLVA
jgi:hypothetical protein